MPDMRKTPEEAMSASQTGTGLEGVFLEVMPMVRSYEEKVNLGATVSQQLSSSFQSVDKPTIAES